MFDNVLLQVHTRVGLVAVGKLSLNLTCFNKEILTVFGNCIKGAVSNLVPFTMCLPLTIDHLNSASLAPAKDYETNRCNSCNYRKVVSLVVYTKYGNISLPYYILCGKCFRLVSGPLQLSEGTHLTVDETQLHTGTLNSVGVENVRLLKTLLESQKVKAKYINVYVVLSRLVYLYISNPAFLLSLIYICIMPKCVNSLDFRILNYKPDQFIYIYIYEI